MTNIPFKNSILSWMMKKRIHQIDLFRKYPIKTQEDVFGNLVEKGKYTSFGEEHSFATISSYSDFCNQVPVRTYEELFPYINRLREGEKDVLWPGKVKWFAKSSGTTNDRSKYIPISKESLEDCHFKGGKDMLSLYCTNFPETKIFNGKGLMLGGSQWENPFQNYEEGDLSAILINNFPFWVNIHRTPNLEIALLKDWELKLEKIVEQSINENVTNLTGVPSWMLLLINRVLKKTGAKNIMEVWPNLELYMHGGINFNPYKHQFKKLIPSSKMNYLEAYNASEGFFGIKDQKDSNDLLLMLDYGIFYEFIEIRKFNEGNRDCIPLSEVKVKNIYVIVISTNAGLWRYLIGDTIRFSSISPYRIRIVGRTKGYINTFGEELMVENTEDAINKCSELNFCSIKNYSAAPEFLTDSSGRHQWLIEFNTPPLSLQKFELDLDSEIRKLNSDYDAKRNNDFILKNLKIIPAKEGVFYKWLKNNDRLGGQYKVPRLFNDNKIFFQILELNR